MQNPFALKIHNQAEDEEIVKVWRHHRITLIPPLLRVMAFLLVPILLVVFTGLSMFASPWLFGLFVIILAVVFTYAAHEWITWYGDVYVLTTYRIIDIDQTGFFDRRFAEATLNRIQDVSYQISGVFETFFDYGDVIVQTAGAQDNVRMDDIADPAQQTKFLLEQQRIFYESNEDNLSAEDLIKLLTKHHKSLDKLGDMEKQENIDRTAEQMDKVQEKSEESKSFRKKKQEAQK